MYMVTFAQSCFVLLFMIVRTLLAITCILCYNGWDPCD
jgi:hypothetical protein